MCCILHILKQHCATFQLILGLQATVLSTVKIMDISINFIKRKMTIISIFLINFWIAVLKATPYSFSGLTPAKKKKKRLVKVHITAYTVMNILQKRHTVREKSSAVYLL